MFHGVSGKDVDDAVKPGLFAAIQQELGLKLEATRRAADVLIMGHAERVSEN